MKLSHAVFLLIALNVGQTQADCCIEGQRESDTVCHQASMFATVQGIGSKVYDHDGKEATLDENCQYDYTPPNTCCIPGDDSLDSFRPGTEETCKTFSDMDAPIKDFGTKFTLPDGRTATLDNECNLIYEEVKSPTEAPKVTDAPNPNDIFCGRVSGNTGPFTKYGPVEAQSAEEDEKNVRGGVMEFKYPGETATINGQTGVLDNDCKIITPSATGDPHFTTFGGEKYDFHGGCDLILLKNPTFANGLGLSAEIRTKIEKFWSYIETAIVQIGEFTLEVTGGEEGGLYWLNGEKEGHRVETGEVALGDYVVKFKRVKHSQSQTRIYLGDGNALEIETFKDFVFVRVHISPKNPAIFNGSVGLMGTYPGGEKMARDGVTVIEDANEFGQEWMVLPTEPMLFHNADEAIERPLKCPMPNKKEQKEARRRLGESAITLEDATQACARVGPADQDACIFDVMATNDKDLAGTY